MSHTPTPWKAHVSESGNNVIRDADGTLIADLRHRKTVEGAFPTSVSEHNANAEFIVRAVNAHKAMVLALDMMLDKFQYDVRENEAGWDAVIAACEALELAKFGRTDGQT